MFERIFTRVQQAHLPWISPVADCNFNGAYHWLAAALVSEGL